LSDDLRGRLAWLAVETGRPLDEVLNVLIDVYVKWQREPETVVTLWKILVLARSLKQRHVDVDDVHGYLSAKAALKEHLCRIEDVPHALQLIERLAPLPQSWTWTMVGAAIQGVAFLIEHGIESSGVAKFLQRHQRFSELGFEEEEAKAVAEALVRACAVGRQRTRVLNRMVRMAGEVINAAELERERIRLDHEVTLLRAEQRQLQVSVQQLRNQWETLQFQVDQLAHVVGEGREPET
jgi:hypothetical protein